jgi:hypothetical protein
MSQICTVREAYLEHVPAAPEWRLQRVVEPDPAIMNPSPYPRPATAGINLDVFVAGYCIGVCTLVLGLVIGLMLG